MFHVYDHPVQYMKQDPLHMLILILSADDMKIAMTKVNKRLKEEKLQSRIVLQVHDELLLEVPTAECEAVKTLLVEQMQSAANLRVPLEVSVSVGNSWYETK